MYLPEGLEDTPFRQFLDKFWTFFLQVWTILDDLKQFWIKFAKRKIKFKCIRKLTFCIFTINLGVSNLHKFSYLLHFLANLQILLLVPV